MDSFLLLKILIGISTITYNNIIICNLFLQTTLSYNENRWATVISERCRQCHYNWWVTYQILYPEWKKKQNYEEIMCH